MLKKLFFIYFLISSFFVIGASANNRPSKKSNHNRTQNKRLYKNYKNRLATRVVLKTPKTLVAKESRAVTTKPLAVEQTKIVEPEPALSPSPTPQVNTIEADKQPQRVEISQMENLGDDVQGGNVVVKVTSNGNANLKLGMAQRGVTIIEFMQNDPVYKIFPGDENFVTVDCGARDKDNRCLNPPTDSIVLRPGKLFNEWGEDASSATVITVQRVSGIVVSFIIVPVRSIAQHAFHVVVRYDLAEVVAQRRSAGLSFNLNQSVLPSTNQPSDGKTTLPPSTTPLNASENSQSLMQNASFTQDQPVDDSSEQTAGSLDDLENRTVEELKRIARSNGKLYFGKPFHNLSVAVSSNKNRVSDFVIEVIAVRNTSPNAIRLVPDQPDLFIDSANIKENSPISSERIPILKVATTAEEDDVLLPNQVYYFAFAYKMPILGAKQVLRVGFSQREAADEPTTAVLLGLSR